MINTNVDLVLKTGSEFEICGEPERPDDRRRKIKKLKSCGFVLVFLENWTNEEDLRKVQRSICCGKRNQLIKTFGRP